MSARRLMPGIAVLMLVMVGPSARGQGVAVNPLSAEHTQANRPQPQRPETKPTANPLLGDDRGQQAAALASNQPQQVDVETLLRRLERSELQIELLTRQLQEQQENAKVGRNALYEVDEEQLNAMIEAALLKYEAGAGDDEAASPLLLSQAQKKGEKPAARFETGYSRGFFIRPTKDTEGVPFDILIRGWGMFRYTGFKSDSGAPALTDRSDFEVERGRLIFSGHFLDPKLGFYLNIDADDDDEFNMKFHDYYFTYEFSKAAKVSWGKWKVPGSRDWLSSSQQFRFADRSLATTFFRPDRTTGVWLHGEPIDKVNYMLMIGNGVNTNDLRPSAIDDQFGFAGTLYWDAVGDYGTGYSDLQMRKDPAVRVGSSFSFTDMDPAATGELRAFRLVDTGQRLVTVGAVPGAFPGPAGAAAGFDVWQYAIDAALKWHGFSLNAEYFFRELQDFEGAAVPVNEIFDHGFFVEGGVFLIPEKLELIGRLSRVVNDGGSPSADEYAGGFNWFFKGHDLKFTFDVSVLNGSPAENSSTNVRAGDDGVMFRAQMVAGF